MAVTSYSGTVLRFVTIFLPHGRTKLHRPEIRGQGSCYGSLREVQAKVLYSVRSSRRGGVRVPLQ